MPKLHSSRLLRGLAILSIVPFLMGFEPHREEGLTVGVGGSYGRGHFSPACTNHIYEEEGMSGAASLEYTFAHDSARVFRPQFALGGRLGMARTETRLIADGEEGESHRHAGRASDGPLLWDGLAGSGFRTLAGNDGYAI